jgi:hypothetical protein
VKDWKIVLQYEFVALGYVSACTKCDECLEGIHLFKVARRSQLSISRIIKPAKLNIITPVGSLQLVRCQLTDKNGLASVSSSRAKVRKGRRVHRLQGRFFPKTGEKDEVIWDEIECPATIFGREVAQDARPNDDALEYRYNLAPQESPRGE